MSNHSDRPLSKKLYWYNILLVEYFSQKYFKNLKLLKNKSDKFWKNVIPQGLHPNQLQPGPPEKFLVINDRQGKHDFVYYMHNNLPDIEYTYHSELANKSFTEVCIETAMQYKATGKIIDIFWSGGLDSTCMLLSFLEICPDQIRVILNPEKNEYMNLFYTRVKSIPHTFVTTLSELYSTAKADTNIFTTGVQADLLFGFFIVPQYLKRFNSYSPETQALIQSLGRRYNHSMFDMRFLSYTKLDKINIDNHKPFFMQPLIEKFAVNNTLENKMVFHASQGKDPNTGLLKMIPPYSQAKMPLRDCIAELSGDRDYASYVQKIPSVAYSFGWQDGSNDYLLKYNNLYKQQLKDTVLAITAEGTVIRGNNINNFNMSDFENPEYLK